MASQTAETATQNAEVAQLLTRQIQLCEEREKEVCLKKKDSDKKDDALANETHLFLGGGHQRTHLCTCPELQDWFSGELRKGAAVLKERRKAREERALRRGK